MRLTLFSRLFLGYLGIFILIIAVSVYAVIELRRFNDITRSVLEGDTRVLDYQKKLTDALLSEIRYERRFLITRDDALYDQFLLFKSDFDLYIEEAMALADARASGFLSQVKDHHQRYQDLVDQEVKYMKAGRSYPYDRYRQGKGRVADLIIAELEKLSSYSQQNTYGKIRKLAEAGSNARRAAMAITGASLIFVIVLSLFITRSITQPISILKMKTREIAKGHFESDVNLSSPPEIAELASAFNSMSQKLKDLDRMKSDFFSSMSHELRTPLTSIKEGAGLLLEGVGGALTEKQRRLLTILAEESERLIGLVNSLLDLSKMEAGMMVYNFEPTSLAPLVNRAMIEIGPLVEAKKIRLDSRIAEELPVITVDSERLLQALRNLIGNAVKFTPDGGQVTISARQRDRAVEVSVADTGPGIPAENLATIFDKFQQAASAGSYRIQGTGLGLAIVKHIITSHGGKVWAESQAGQGSTFIFVLPA
ncbi:MAG: HAMP domain-containing protein [Deltaproteobacteria bacterium]|nr:HAMP domain-containing protein [Deltaproteobacteria bacterium]